MLKEKRKRKKKKKKKTDIRVQIEQALVLFRLIEGEDSVMEYKSHDREPLRTKLASSKVGRIVSGEVAPPPANTQQMIHVFSEVRSLFSLFLLPLITQCHFSFLLFLCFFVDKNLINKSNFNRTQMLPRAFHKATSRTRSGWEPLPRLKFR